MRPLSGEEGGDNEDNGDEDEDDEDDGEEEEDEGGGDLITGDTTWTERLDLFHDSVRPV